MAWGFALWAGAGCLADLTFERSAGAFCDRDDACSGTNYCDRSAQRCKPLIPQGAGCTTPNQCASGFCSDGICCNGPCNVACLTCAAPEALGECGVQQAGSDPRGDCPGAAACGEEGFCEGAPKWAVRFGDLRQDRAVDAALDGDGNVVVVGTFAGQISFGPEDSHTSNGGDDIFLLKLDAADGAVLFSTTFGSAGDDHIAGVEIDGSCDIIIAGDFEGQLNLFGDVLTAEGERDGYVARLARGPTGPCDHTAASSWVRSVAGLGRAALHDLSAGPDGEVALVGDFDGDLDFGGAFPIVSQTTVTGWAASIASDGSWKWRRTHGDDVYQQHTVAVVVDHGGNAIVAVNGSGDIDFGGANGLAAASTSDSDMLVAKLDASDGSALWQFPYDGDGDQWASAIAVDLANEVWFTGSFVDEVNIPGSGLVAGYDGIDGFYVKLTADGGHVGSGALLGPFDDEPHAIAIDDRQSAVVVGGFDLALDLADGGTLDTNGDRDIFVLSLAADGAPQWGVPYGGVLDDQAVAVVVAPTDVSGDHERRGDLIATGSFQGDIAFGDVVLRATGSSDIFVARFAR